MQHQPTPRPRSVPPPLSGSQARFHAMFGVGSRLYKGTLVPTVPTVAPTVPALIPTVGTVAPTVGTLTTRVGSLMMRVATLTTRVGTLGRRVGTLGATVAALLASGAAQETTTGAVTTTPPSPFSVALRGELFSSRRPLRLGGESVPRIAQARRLCHRKAAALASVAA